MKNLIRFTTVVSLIILFTSCQQQKAKKAQSIDSSITKIELIDFYGTHRCTTCINIEAFSKFTIDNYFKNEMKNGKILFRTVNIDDKLNNNLVEKYQIYGTALFINIIKNGKEKHLDLTDFAFLNGDNKELFVKILKQKISDQLKAL